jgi:hypothetical protein
VGGPRRVRAKKPHILFERQRREKGKVTNRWEVYTQPRPGDKLGDNLGSILWYTSWRRYVFEPSFDIGPWTRTVVFDASCLRMMADFCEGETIKHREARKRQKETKR